MDITLERILSLIPHKPNGDFEHGAKKEFAQSIGLKNGNLVTDWIKGRTASYTNYIYEIASKYDVSADWLFGNTDIKKAPPENGKGLTDAQKLLLEQIQDLSDEQLYKLIKIVNEAKNLLI